MFRRSAVEFLEISSDYSRTTCCAAGYDARHADQQNHWRSSMIPEFVYTPMPTPKNWRSPWHVDFRARSFTLAPADVERPSYRSCNRVCHVWHDEAVQLSTAAEGHAADRACFRDGARGTFEVFGGLLMVIGLFTRPVAFLLSGEMAVAYFQFHYPRSFWPTENMGTPPILYCFIFLYLVFAGAGLCSVDTMIARSKASGT